ncbi:alpha-N-acetylneuraminide alpha-2,8-sialyltransferase-like isoform X2 [Ptychodera flava]|uniref:alpha-N-acetylneuraminide alpha-2,8-sialyltransferase-like isoform X2 n=1 Tax=Ptychodera flava TaxID=63121 RepID=UPI00396A952B
MSCRFIYRRRKQLSCFVIAMLFVYFTLASFMVKQSHSTVKKRHHQSQHNKVTRLQGDVKGGVKGGVKGAVNGTKSRQGAKFNAPINGKNNGTKSRQGAKFNPPINGTINGKVNGTNSRQGAKFNPPINGTINGAVNGAKSSQEIKSNHQINGTINGKVNGTNSRQGAKFNPPINGTIKGAVNGTKSSQGIKSNHPINGTINGKVNGTKSRKRGKVKPRRKLKKPNIMESVLKNGTFDVLKIFKSIHQNWTFNATAAEGFRLLAENGCNTSGTFLVTKRNLKINDTLPYNAEEDRQWTVTSDVLNRLPQDSPYKWNSFKKCSIVGSSGILLGSKCGNEIDSSDFVVRYNFAKIRNFEDDVGSKTSLMTCNPSVFEKNYYGLTENTTEQFRKDVLTEYGNTTIYIPAFANRLGNQLAFRAQDALNSTSVRILFPNPLHMISVKSFWKLRGVGGLHPSSGLLLFTTVLSLCQEINLYGYWPFTVDAYGTPVYYHYFDTPDAVHRIARLQGRYHNMPAELMSMINLHNRGIIRLHYGQC